MCSLTLIRVARVSVRTCIPVAAGSAARAVGHVGPAGDFAGDVIGDAADGEVGIGVGDHHGELGGGVEFAGTRRGADAGLANADRDDLTLCHCRLPMVDGSLAVRRCAA